MSSAISVRDLRKSYDGVEALRGVSFEVAEGEVFGLLGPNGAGKTTTVEILEGYRRRDGGDASVLGHDPGAAPRELRERIGVVLQQSELNPLLTVRETHRMFAGYYARPRDVDEVIALVGLEEKRDARLKTLSGGQKRRLDLGIALVGDPALLFLDEPTTGFDPSARRQAWETVKGLTALGKTIVLTTHFMDEAQALADRLAIIAEGRIIATGTAAELIGAASSTTTIRFGLDDGAVPPEELRLRPSGSGWELETDEPTAALHRLTGWAVDAGVELRHLEVARRSLEDVYLQLTAETEAAE
jgi:ABC-2 type transport system ATP-binding protein